MDAMAHQRTILITGATGKQGGAADIPALEREFGITSTALAAWAAKLPRG
jgi:uncharacterized protein YbjT (DUF2867 family)